MTGIKGRPSFLPSLKSSLPAETAVWTIPVPSSAEIGRIFECEKCGNFDIISSKQELKERAIEGWDEFEGKSPHKPQIDQVKIACEKCGEKVKRIGDVGNVWLDAGIVPFSTLIAPNSEEPSYTGDKKYWSDWFPADFITESFPGQFKNWFYSMIAMSTVLEDTNPFKTVLGYASVLAEDGRPMHKSWGNAIEFNEGASKIGVDVMRWLYARQNPLSNLLFGYNAAAEVRRRVILILWNSYRFFANAAALDNWQPEEKEFKSDNLLDQWIVSRLVSTIQSAEKSLDSYDVFHAVSDYEELIRDISNWYIRRSRDRFDTSNDQTDKLQAFQTMHFLFTNLSIVLSPIIPFISDQIYTNLTGEETVHLADWPKLSAQLSNPKLESSMQLIREITEKVHAIRREKGIRVRQPLAKLTISTADPDSLKELTNLLCDELNIKEVVLSKGEEALDLDTTLTAELEQEGIARDLMRDIQKARKQLALQPNQKIDLLLPDWPAEFAEEIKLKTNANSITKGEKLEVKPIE